MPKIASEARICNEVPEDLSHERAVINLRPRYEQRWHDTEDGDMHNELGRDQMLGFRRRCFHCVADHVAVDDHPKRVGEMGCYRCNNDQEDQNGLDEVLGRKWGDCGDEQSQYREIQSPKRTTPAPKIVSRLLPERVVTEDKDIAACKYAKRDAANLRPQRAHICGHFRQFYLSKANVRFGEDC
jgi:hypothetical protein